MRIFRCLLLVLPALLTACAGVPLAEPETVGVKANRLGVQYSSFNARVIADAVAMDHTLAASLDSEMVTRLESSLTQDNLRIGDTVSSSGMWGRSVRYGGVQFGRARVSSDAIAAEELATEGLAVLPTVADALFASVGDAAGVISQQRVSIQRAQHPGSARTWDLTAQDSFGRSVSLDAPLIAPTRLVAQGCSDFAMGIGKVRRDYAITSNEYGPLYANTTVTCGGPLGFTVEGRGEFLADEVAALGVGLARRLGGLGTASLAFASSYAEQGRGWLARIGFEHENALFKVMVRSRLQSREFRDVGSVQASDSIMQRNLASIGWNVSEAASLSLSYAEQTTWSNERANLIALKQSINLGRGAVAMSAGHSLTDNFESSVFLSYKRPFGFARPQRSLIDEFELDGLSVIEN